MCLTKINIKLLTECFSFSSRSETFPVILYVPVKVLDLFYFVVSEKDFFGHTSSLFFQSLLLVYFYLLITCPRRNNDTRQEINGKFRCQRNCRLVKLPYAIHSWEGTYIPRVIITTAVRTES